jgi:leucyl/phenylalanyl-tRNA--protein transferase
MLLLKSIFTILLVSFSINSVASNTCDKSFKQYDFEKAEPKDPKDEDGFLVSADQVPLNTKNILEAYKNGAFPWNSDASGKIGWYKPAQHGVIPLDKIVVRGEKLEKKLRKAWNKGISQGWYVTFNRAFERVIEECAQATRANYSHVWLTETVKQAFMKLHEEGHAHSVELWNAQGELIGGTYGLYRGNIFSGESVFGHKLVDGERVRVNDAGKVAILALSKRLYATGHSYTDTQTVNQTTATIYGAYGIPAKEYPAFARAESERLKGKISTNEVFNEEIWVLSETPSWMPQELLPKN